MNPMVLTTYNREFIDHRSVSSLGEFRPREDAFQWLHIDQFDASRFQEMLSAFGMTDHMVEVVSETGRRPKFENHGHYLYFTLKANNYDETRRLEEFQLGVLLFEKTLVTILDTPKYHPFDPTEVLEEERVIQRYDVEYLLHLIIDKLLDIEFDSLEALELEIDDLEDNVLSTPKQEELHQIYNIKKDLIYIRKTLWPNQTVLRNLQYTPEFIDHPYRYFFQDITSRLEQAIELVESYREICSGMLDTYLSSVSNRTNDIMKILTILATIFSPLSFLTGLYGMNFKYFPELNWRYGYLSFWLVSLLITAIMLWYFKKKGWFGD
ncbi:MAG: magnesium/cobalt transporter CorA [Firmicutes bacterium]|nr:magnesium/cobalt transporter CorA [Bacillota bacterium]